ncbi:alpha-1,4-glucan--maltose-1-phosphate maltosyltransferase [Pseudoclavibacter endophyticus]|uniref:Alpha-1,4-glucan:maltose-1-phosphate maltosyltransferase n=1 Tax=Pseudoclavibacter endophyticus TaxID=1778590 RepID=A0A6H9WMM8_9MICO|nr:alpha-1,4-glucan--maltose-1-phosphate maltosyltransferase [Pseudoclavibacter endophyticus]KAB1647928.1 alpha-1,4-glucan--maltose-1-phosphate maltosyltransferase [Pseudoclavibacter endophyticus]
MLDLRPQLADNLFPAKSYEGDVVPFSAVAFREGHDRIGVELVIASPSGRTRRVRMQPGAPGTDRWETTVQPAEAGLHTWHVEAWGDDVATWRHNAGIKIPAGIDVEVMLEQGARVLDAATRDPQLGADDAAALRAAAERARVASATPDERFAALMDDAITSILDAHPVRSLLTRSDKRHLKVERRLAGTGAWYEFFPRSEGAERQPDGSWRSGTFGTAAKRVPEVARMGFDVLYLPPIHPIGRTNRKGPNNTLTAGPGDPGSPWAIGAAEGGHRSIHPDLGTEDDFRDFVRVVRDNGLELALDIALQAAPDHPWVTEHPEWFTVLPDGSIAYAENPPKKYQDIYPLNFDVDRNGLYQEVLDTFEYWISFGVTLFRVDNPHTKPLQFWEWVIHEVGAKHPDVIFLSEAFTRPAVMQALAKVGFQQSYTYFTWRNTKEELEEYLTEVSKETSDFLRPNFFVNTPDILTEYLQLGGPPAYRIRAIMAAMGSPLWGMYAGYELIENVARPGSEENLDNEKYEYKQRDWAAEEAVGRSLAPFITRLNEIRRAHPALQQLRNLEVHETDGDSIVAFSKHLAAEHNPAGVADTIIVIATVDPYVAHETTVHLDLERLGLVPGDRFDVEDLLTGRVWNWGDDNYVRLDPREQPAHVLHVRGRTA